MSIKQLSISTIMVCFAVTTANLLPIAKYAKAQTRIKYGTAEVQRGKSKSFFSDWDLCTDNSNGTALDKSALKKGQSYFYGFMDRHGRITELRYYDLGWVHRWTKRFTYASAGQHRYQYLAPNGQRINHQRQELRVKKHFGYPQGTPKEKIKSILGEPVIIQIDKFGMEKWRYYDGEVESWYTFNARGELDYSNYRR